MIVFSGLLPVDIATTPHYWEQVVRLIKLAWTPPPKAEDTDRLRDRITSKEMAVLAVVDHHHHIEAVGICAINQTKKRSRRSFLVLFAAGRGLIRLLAPAKACASHMHCHALRAHTRKAGVQRLLARAGFKDVGVRRSDGATSMAMEM